MVRLAPSAPKVFHITHINNIELIVESGYLLSDAERIRQGSGTKLVGMSRLKRRRLEELEVHPFPGTKVGEYVPFYFCPRSVMLFVLHRGNHAELDYNEGQRPILHLQADFNTVIEQATENSVDWCFTTSNASARYTRFLTNQADLAQLDWPAITARDFRDRDVMEAKQAEFLVYATLPWRLIEVVGVYDQATKDRVETLIAFEDHQPKVEIRKDWYY